MSVRALHCAAVLLILVAFVGVAVADDKALPPTHPINLDFESGPGASGFPAGWDTEYVERITTGGGGFDVVLDHEVFHGGNAGVRIELVGEPGYPPQGMVVQTILANEWRGRKIKVSAFMKSRDVEVDAGVIVWVLGDNGVLAHDGMEDRVITGTTDWAEHWVAVGVPEAARFVAFGAWLDGKGAVWVDDVEVVEAGDDVPIAATGELVDTAPTEAQVGWLRSKAVEFKTAEAGSGFDDLEPLRDMVGDARIVALGEGTHGTREFFQMKHRIVEFLATEMGFTLFAIEANTPEAQAINPYVLGGDGDPRALIAGMYFWTWNTEEVLAMVEWMRAFNASGEGRIEFAGFDMQYPDVAMDVVTSFVKEVDPEEAVPIEEVYGKMRTQKQTGGFGVATWKFPVEQARGKTARFSGYIKTEGLSDGWAGLWWRVDGEDKAMLAFDNMMAKGPKGTTDWTRYEIELPVAEEAVNINFGVLMPGYGKAWFDELRIELDGEPFSDPEFFDFDFEWSAFKNYYASQGGSHEAFLDAGVFFSGAQSYRLESAATVEEADDAIDTVKLSAEILEQLEASRDRYVAAGSAQQADWAIHNARIVNQCMRMKGGSFVVRDASMAANVSWILDQHPGEKIVLWAHNGHIKREGDWMGNYLTKEYGADYVPVGFAASGGKYTAWVKDGGLQHDNELAAPPTGSVESFFDATGSERLILDLRVANPDDEASGWLGRTRLFRSIGAMAMDSQFYPSRVRDLFDVLIYFRDTTASVKITAAPEPKD